MLEGSIENTLVLDKKNTREKINEEKMKNHVRKGYKGKINKRKVKNKKDIKKCETCYPYPC